MFLSPFVSKYLKADATFSTAVGSKIYHERVPQPDAAVYCVVLPGVGCDNGQVSNGFLTHKVEDFTILLVGTDLPSLVLPSKRLLELINACKAQTVTSSYMASSVFISSLVAADSQYVNSIILDGKELGKPGLIYPVRGCYSGPVPTA